MNIQKAIDELNKIVKDLEDAKNKYGADIEVRPFKSITGRLCFEYFTEEGENNNG